VTRERDELSGKLDELQQMIDQHERDNKVLQDKVDNIPHVIEETIQQTRDNVAKEFEPSLKALENILKTKEQTILSLLGKVEHVDSQRDEVSTSHARVNAFSP
jgi:chromosome segregation ATPase